MDSKGALPEAQAFLAAESGGYRALDAASGDGGGAAWRKRARAVAAAALSLTALAAVLPKHLSVTLNFYGHRGPSEEQQQLDSAAAPPFSFAVKSGSYADAPGLGYSFVHAARFVEPYRTSVFTVSGPVTSCAWSTSKNEPAGLYDEFLTAPPSTGFAASGTVAAVATAGNDDAAGASGSGLSFSVDYQAPGFYAVSLTCDLADGSSFTLDEEVSCLYVRRELRELSLVDREAFLDGFMTLYKTGAVAGQKKYGKHFKPLSEFVTMHLDAAGARNLDHIHDGLGLLTQHTALTMAFELALQAVTPRLAVPYWDYTVDSAKIAKRNPDGLKTSISSIFHSSELFNKNFFGETDLAVNHVTEGRFAHVQVARDYSAVTKSPRGFLRAPWNVNPSAHVTRYHAILGADEVIPEYQDLVWPTCASHLGLATSKKYDDWYSWAWAAGYMPHGPVHSWVGGVGGGNAEAVYDDMLSKGLIDESQARQLKVYAFMRLKNLWRVEVIETPKYCSEDAKVEDCTWACIEDVASNTNAQSYMDMAGIYADAMGTVNYQIVLTRAICEVTYWPGDMFEAASPIEASFWPIHPTMDRLIQYKDIVQPFTEKTWMGTTSTGEACLETTTDCKGHNAGDLTFWKSVTKGSDGSYTAGYQTNEEVRNSILPTGDYTVPYIYNHFEWAHCDELGDVFPKVTHEGNTRSQPAPPSDDAA